MQRPSLRLLAAAFLSLIIVGGIPGPAVAGESFALRVPVLMYHRITCAPPDATLPALWLCPGRFEAHLRALDENGWSTITAHRLARKFDKRRAVGPKHFVVSIDDGMADGYTTAHPILLGFGMRATYYVNPGKVHDTGPPWLISFDRMRALRAAGHDVASHSLDHADLTRLSGAALREQVEDAQAILTEELGYRPRTLCYPLGRHDSEVRRVVQESGLTLAFTTAHGALQSSASPMSAPRIRINGWDTASDVLAKVAPYAGE